MAMNQKHLSSLPKLNKDQFIASYIKGQKAFAKLHLSEGKAMLSLSLEPVETGTAAADPPRTSIQPRGEDYGFGTPVLRARTQDAATHKPSFRMLEPNNEGPSQRPQRKRKNSLNKSASSPEKIRQVNGRNEKAIGSRENRTRPQDELRSTDLESNEKAIRLGERRQRKKAKREILKPSSQHIAEKTKVGPGTPQKAAPKSKVKHLPGFALMHGFSATNVGKNRLTMEHPVGRPGVFGKGKASTKAQVDPRKGKKKGAGFSEFEFLNGADKLLAKAKAPKVSPSIVGSGTSIDEPMRDRDGPDAVSRKMRKADKIITNKAKNKNKKRLPSLLTSDSDCSNGSSEASNAPDLTSNHLSGARAESIIWDIEKENSALESNAASNSPTKTAVLDTTGNRYCWNRGTLSKRLSISDKTELDEGKTHSSSPSLGPSQSASQLDRTSHPCVQEKAGGPLSRSRFFHTSMLQHIEHPASNSEDLQGGAVRRDPHILGSIGSNLGGDISGSHGSYERECAWDKERPSSLRFPTQLRTSPEALGCEFDDYKDNGYNGSGVDSLMEGYECFVKSSQMFEPTNTGCDYEDTFNIPSGLHSGADLHGVDWGYEQEYEDLNMLLGCETDRIALLEDEVLSESIVAWPQLDYDDGRYFQPFETPSYEADGFSDFSDQAPGQDTINPCSSQTNSIDSYSFVGGDDAEQVDQFFQGRALLLGYTLPLQTKEPQQDVTMTKAEAEVAKVLKHHWLPQKL